MNMIDRSLNGLKNITEHDIQPSSLNTIEDL